MTRAHHARRGALALLLACTLALPGCGRPRAQPEAPAPAPPPASAPASPQTSAPAAAPRQATTPPASPASPRASAPAGEAKAAPLGIEQLAKDPAAFAGRDLKVRGVVAAVAPARRLFTLIPQSEYDACREVTCSSFEVPVSWDGPPPRSAQPVLVTGRLREPEPGRFVLEAASVEVRQ